MKLRSVIQLMLLASVIMFTVPSCVKEGPMGLTGPAGANGKDGKDGVDANQTCKMCHNPTTVDQNATQFAYSKHSFGEAAISESGIPSCTPCHAQKGFQWVVANKTPATFTLNPTTNKYTNDYFVGDNSATYGKLTCATCHSSIHSTYGSGDMVFTSVEPVSMNMWGGKKTIDLPADNHSGNLCVKCHQPRPITNALTGDVLDYDALANTTGVAFDGDPASKTNIIKPAYRTHVHYGAIGAIYAGMGGVEFKGSLPYTNSAHTTVAACTDCHMGTMQGKSGGHTFSALGKFDGCNTTGCHSTPITSSTSNYWVNPRAEIKKLLGDLAAKLTINGVEIMNRNRVSSENFYLNIEGKPTLIGANLFAGVTTNNYDGYLNVYDPVTNPGAQTYNASSFQYVGTPPASWSQAQKDYNATLPKLTLSYTQMGAIINFQLCLRDYSLGIHNYAYTKALLTNTIAKL